MRHDPWKMTLAGVAGLIVLACGGGSVATSGDAPDTTAATVAGAPATAATAKTPATKAGFGDVTITTCAFPPDNEFLGPEATVKITNGSSKASNYIVQVAFVSKDGATQYDTGTVAVNGLAPGQAAENKASSLKGDLRKTATGGVTCKVLDVTRYAA